jgi:hypothetical protein
VNFLVQPHHPKPESTDPHHRRSARDARVCLLRVCESSPARTSTPSPCSVSSLRAINVCPNASRVQNVLQVGPDVLQVGQKSQRLGQDSSKLGQKSHRLGQDSSKLGQKSQRLGQDFSEDGPDLLELGQDFSEDGPDFLELGQDFSEGGPDFSELGQESPRLGQDFLSLGQDISSLGQDFSEHVEDFSLVREGTPQQQPGRAGLMTRPEAGCSFFGQLVVAGAGAGVVVSAGAGLPEFLR